MVVGVPRRRVRGEVPVTTARSQWTTVSRVLPAPLRGDALDVPQLRGFDKAAIDGLKAEAKAHQGLEELRLGYVAFTRGQARAVGLGLPVEPDAAEAAGARRPTSRRCGRRWRAGESSRMPGRRLPEDGTPNPLQEDPPSSPWPTQVRTEEHERRLVSAQLVREAVAAPGSTVSRSWTWSSPRRSPSGTRSSSGWSPRPGPTGRRRSRCRCRRASRPRPSPGCGRTRTASPASWHARCLASRRRPRGSAPGSTPGSRLGSASSPCWIPTTSRAAPTWPSTTRTTSGR